MYKRQDVDSVIELPIVEPVYDGEKVSGTIDVLDVRFGSLWTNISRELFKKLGVGHGGRVETVSYTHLDVYKRQVFL